MPAIIFLVAFLPRAVNPISSPIQWEERAFRFSEAVLEGDWANTYQQYHPGVTVMWLSGIGAQTFLLLHGETTEGRWYLDENVRTSIKAEAVALMVLPLTLVISLSITVAYLLLIRLVDRKIALVASFLLALNPFYLTYSRVVHVDALLASFMLLSMLALLVFLRERKARYLMLSGGFAGLALLTKTPSVFLVPYTILILTVTIVGSSDKDLRTLNWRDWIGSLTSVARNFLIWAVVAVLVFVALWPAIWMMPVEIAGQMVANLMRHTANPHHNPIYFNGEIFMGDPGPLFYLAVIAWKATAITLPLIVLAVLLVFRRSKTVEGKLLLAILAFVFFFFGQMSLGQFKQVRYMLPLSPALSLVAAFGLVWGAEKIGKLMPKSRIKQWLPAVLIVSIIALQAFIVLRKFPYFGTHYNALLGGTRTAMQVLPIQDQAEGMDLAAEFINSIPHSQTALVSITGRNRPVFQRAFAGRSSYLLRPESQYRVYDVYHRLRDVLTNDWKLAELADQEGEPLFTVEFDGITYVWVFGDVPDAPAIGGPELETNFRFGEHIWLRKVRLSKPDVAPGDTFSVVLMWESDGQVTNDYKVFNHLLSEDQELVAQTDDFPLLNIRPPKTWNPGELMEDTYEIFVGHDVPPEDYNLAVGFYDPETLIRLDAYDGDGNRLSDDSAILVKIRVSAPAS